MYENQKPQEDKFEELLNNVELVEIDEDQLYSDDDDDEGKKDDDDQDGGGSNNRDNIDDDSDNDNDNDNSGTGDNDDGGDDKKQNKNDSKDNFVLEVPYKGESVKIEGEDKIKVLVSRGLLQQEISEKYNKVKPFEKVIKQNKLKLEDIKALADAKAGNEQAIKYLNEKVLGAGDEPDYTPSIEDDDWIEQKLQETRETYGDLGSEFSRVLTSLPTGFLDELEQVGDEGFNTIFDHYQAGVFKSAIKQAIAQKAVNGGRYLDHYINALKALDKGQEGQQNNKNGGKKPNKKKKGVDLSKMSDEEFNKYLESL